MTKFALTLLSLTSLSAWAAPVIHDLDFRKSETFDVHVFSKRLSATQTAMYYSLEHNYTNTLICQLNVSFPVSKGDDDSRRFIRLTLSNDFVFPTAAFPESYPYNYKIDTSDYLGNGESADANYDKILKGSATCHGFGPDDRLPSATCRAVNPQHDELCSSLLVPGALGKPQYPVAKNDTFIGLCACP